MQSPKTKDVLIYATMPRILPRAKQIFSSGFSYISFLMAHIYFMARLLPNNHPYLLSENIGRFGIRHVIGEASRNLKFSLRNIDQILIYFALLTCVLMLAAQICVLIYAMVVSPAMAFSWFDTPDPSEDIAFNLLDRVFGVPGIFCSSATPANCTAYGTGIAAGIAGPATGAAVIPLPFHTALHGLFTFYSTALLSVGVLIFAYFIVVIIFETAVSGTPFGQRFQNVWVPVRLVVALGLLVPVQYGLGSGQFIVLYVAKYGSSFATTGWSQFNTAVQGHGTLGGSNAPPSGWRRSMLAIPEAPDITPIVEAMSIIHACAYSYHRMVANGPNQTNPSSPNYDELYEDYTFVFSNDSFRVAPYFVKKVESAMVDGAAVGSTPIIGKIDEREQLVVGTVPTYMDALGFYYGGNIVIRFGEYAVDASGSDKWVDETGKVKPLCGDIRIPVISLRDAGGAVAGPSRGGADAMLKFYYDTVIRLWFYDVEMRQFARSYVESAIGKDLTTFCSATEPSGGDSASGAGTSYDGFLPITAAVPLISCQNYPPTADWKARKIADYQKDQSYSLRDAILQAWRNYVNNSIYANMTSDIIDYGWGGAGIWYNKIAEVNGGWMDGVNAIPTMETYPQVMEQVKDANQQSNENVEHNKQFIPSVKAQSAKDASGKIIIDHLDTVARPLSAVYAYWNEEQKNFDAVNRTTYKNIFMDAVNRLMGLNGLSDIRTTNAHLHPMAQLVMVGKGLVDSAVINLAGSTGSAFLGGMAGAMQHGKSSGVLKALSEVLLSTAFMGLTAGFVLFYILPFLPFVYFYFAVASWVKAIFEAMVGVPLWALAHLRIDGDGLPGDSAQNGYFLLLEIFIRPILTVVGLVAAIIIFSTQVRILNLIWDLVTTNASGYTPAGQDILTGGKAATPVTVYNQRFQRGIIDQFFFTVIYTIVCYMMALASFKLIDRIPDNILRWAGAGVSAFGDINQEQVDSLSRYAAMGGMTMGNQAAGAIVKGGGGLGQAIGKEVGGATKVTPKASAAPPPPTTGKI